MVHPVVLGLTKKSSCFARVPRDRKAMEFYKIHTLPKKMQICFCFSERSPSFRRLQKASNNANTNRRPKSSYIPSTIWNLDQEFGTVIQRPQITKLWTAASFEINTKLLNNLLIASSHFGRKFVSLDLAYNWTLISQKVVLYCFGNLYGTIFRTIKSIP